MKKITKIAVAALLMVAGMPGAAQNNVTITCNYTTGSEVEINEIMLLPRTTNLLSYTIYPMWQETNSFTVEPGTYDLLGSFYSTDGTGTSYFILKDNINVQNDTTIDLKVSDAKRFAVKALSPEGEVFKTDTWDFVNGEYVCTELGNVNSCIRYGVLLRKTDGCPIIRLSMNSSNNVFYINDFGDDIIYMESDLYYNDEADGEFYLTKFYKDGNGTSCTENNVNDYICSEEDFLPSCAGEDNNKNKGISVDMIYNGNIINNLNANLSIGNEAKFWSCVPFEQECKFDVMYRPVFGELQMEVYDYRDENDVVIFSDTTYQVGNAYGPAIAFVNGEKHYICNNYFVNTSNDFLNDVNDNFLQSVYPGSANFSYAEHELGGIFGDNVPINVFVETGMDNFMNPGEILPVFNCYYTGRYGEYRQLDNQPMDMLMTVDGEPIDCTYSGLSNYFAPWNFGRVKGVTEFTFDNQNVKVDDLQGRNLTKVVIDENKDDHCAPTMTMLQMRDGNNTVTDRFETAQDGKVIFSCGDFNNYMESISVVGSGGFINTFQKFYFECERPIVEVSVSPYGQDEWQELNITEDTDTYMSIGFGHVFNADITSLNSEGWYDLKFKLTDATGNWQEQMISPAFLIGSSIPTGIESVSSDNATEVARYTIDGRAISAPEVGVNIVKMSDGSVKKVLVK